MYYCSMVVVVVIMIPAVCICFIFAASCYRTVLVVANGPLSCMTNNKGDLGERHSSADRI